MSNTTRLTLADSNVAVGPQVDRVAYLEQEIERLMDLHEVLESRGEDTTSVRAHIARYDSMLGHDG